MEMGITTKGKIREIDREKRLVTADDQNMLKEMFSDILRKMPEAELDTEPYRKYF